MAHIVKCMLCGLEFDRDTTPYKKVNSRRYAHQECPQAQIEEVVDKLNCENYLKQIFHVDTLPYTIKAQFDKCLSSNYTYSGIQKTLQYWYEVKKKPIKLGCPSLGIVPYVYEDAKKYFYKIYEAEHANTREEIEEKTNIETKIVKIQAPPRRQNKQIDF